MIIQHYRLNFGVINVMILHDYFTELHDILHRDVQSGARKLCFLRGGHCVFSCRLLLTSVKK